ncbi:MAG: TatD family hydrolase [Lachnospiraceae bacterium]|nr:TatD family hydrolase [Lachnospiraceae bacterium]
MIVESHAHYDDKAFDEDREALLESLPKEGIGYVINIGASLETTENTIALTKKYPFMFGAAGVHPSETGELNEENFAWLKEQCTQPKIVAVGEIGLDYYWDEPDRQIQKKWFDRQMELAREVELPMIIHSRDAAGDTLDMMKAAGAGAIGGVIHCFSYSKEIAREFLDMNFYFGIGGVITFQNAKKLKEAVAYIPMENILLETDSPYLAPVPYRGKRNSSLYLPLIAKEIARIKGLDEDEVISVSTENAKRLFGIQ